MASAVVLAVTVGWGSPASAHSASTESYFGSGGVSADHTRAYACDTRNDGNVVFTEYNRSNSWGAVYDYNHTSSGCGWASVNFCITSYRVCMAVTNGKVCGGWQTS